MRYGASYWGRDATVAAEHFAEMADDGFSWVVIPVSEERATFDVDGVRRIITAGRDAGLHVSVSPWGVGRWFGGEGVAGSPSTPETALALWLDRMQSTWADAIYWDEPQSPEALRWVVSGAADTAPIPASLYINRYLCPMPDELPLHIAGVGLDNYRRTPEATGAMATALRHEYGRDVHVWVRAFRLGDDETHMPADDIRALRAAGVTDIGVWGYPSEGCSILNNANPHDTWQAIRRVVRDVA
jgi:hypothetical protein